MQLNKELNSSDIWSGRDDNDTCLDGNQDMADCEDQKLVACGVSGNVWITAWN